MLPVFILACSVEKKAQKSFKAGEFQEVIDTYKNVLAKNSNDATANYYIAESYRRSNRPKEAVEFYEKALSMGVKNDTIQLNYAYSLKSDGKYEEAKKQIDDYLRNVKDEELRKKANEQAEGLEMLDILKEKESFYRVKNLDLINTPNTEYSPVYMDGYLYFTSNRYSSKIYKTTGTGFTNLYRAATEGAVVDSTTIESLSEAINTVNINEGTLTFNPAGTIMVFARGNGKKRKDRSDVDLYLSRLRNGRWTAPQMIGTAVNDPNYWDSTPAFSRDGRTLYFASDRPGGFGGVDIYSARLSSRGRFSQARNLGPEINTAGNDMFPSISDDGHLYFASDGHPGFGGLDLFKVNRGGGRIEIENMGQPMNSPADDFGINLFKTDRGFFASNRDGGKGDDDIYTFLNQDPDLKVVNYYLAGTTVTPNENDSLLVLPNSTVKLLDYKNDEIDIIETGPDGRFLFRVYEHEHYTLVGSKKSQTERYLTTRLPYTTVGRAVDRTKLTEMVTNITYDTLLVLEKEEVNKVFVLENIYYDLDRWEIRPDAAIELDKLVTLLIDNPEIKIELSSHTDSRQTDAYNNRLSERRAKSAVDYLVTQGIDPTRLVARGYGESKPYKIRTSDGREIVLTENYIESKLDVDEREELHQLNRRTEFKILEITQSQIEFDEDRFFKNDGNKN